MKSISHLSPFAAVLLLATGRFANAHDVDPYNDGWIAHVNDHHVEICYQHAPSTVGQTVYILRTSYIAVSKGPVRQQFRRSGTARIMNLESNGCVAAELLDGSAERSDHARPLKQ